MGVTIHVTGEKAADLPITSEELMRELGTLAERLIRTRTERQIDVNGAPFRPLSTAYAKAKADAGLSPVPDLTVSGRMLNDMVVTDVTQKTASIGFVSSGGGAVRTGRRKKGQASSSTFIQRSRALGAADKAFYHSEVGAGRSQVVREFFALSEADEDKLEEALDTYYERTLNG